MLAAWALFLVILSAAFIGFSVAVVTKASHVIAIIGFVLALTALVVFAIVLSTGELRLTN